MFAPRLVPQSTPIALRLLGLFDQALIDDFARLEPEVSGRERRTVLVDVRDLAPLGQADLAALGQVIARARAAGRDVRLDATTLPWRRVLKNALAAQPPIADEDRHAVRRTVIIANSGKRRRR